MRGQKQKHSRANHDNIPSEMTTVRLHVGGMTCVTCTRTVSAALDSVEGVERSEVNALAESAVVFLRPTVAVSLQDLVDAVEDVGFSAELPPGAVGATHSGGSGRAGSPRSSVEEMDARRLRETLTWKTRFTLALIFTVPCFLLAMIFPM